MNDVSRSCPDCNASYLDTDNYCRQCGMYVAALREVPLVKAERPLPARLERERAALPAPVKKAATALAIGTALQIGVGIAGKYVANQAARQAARAAVGSTRKQAPAKSVEKAPALQPPDPRRETTAVSETVLIRRIWIRRND